MNILYINLKAQSRGIKKDLLKAVSNVFDDSNYILGEEVTRFEERLARYCDAKYAVGVNSGTDALFLSLKALGIGPGDEVITVPNSFLATTSSIVATGATPVFIDVRQDMNIDPDLICNAVTEKSRVILPVHLTGRPAQMDAIMDIADEKGLRVIEDCAQAIGAEFKGRRVGSFGDVNAFSMHPLKNLNACGDAGAITTNDIETYKILLQLRNIGLKDRDHADIWGYNSRLDTIQAAILNVKFRHLDRWTKARRKNAEQYTKKLKNVVDNVPAEGKDEKCVYHTYVIQDKIRDELKRRLEVKGVQTKIHYPIPIHLQKAFSQLRGIKGIFPLAEKQSREILSLPVYPELKKEQINYISDSITKFKELKGG